MFAVLLVLVGSALAASARPDLRVPQTFSTSSFSSLPLPLRSSAQVPLAQPFPSTFSAPSPAFGSSAQVPLARSFLDDSSSAGVAPSFIQRPVITVVERTHQADNRGQFTSSFTDSAGTSQSETGNLQRTNDGLDDVLVKSGSYSYRSPEGIPITVTYTADATGFHPSGNAIPVAAVVAPVGIQAVF